MGKKCNLREQPLMSVIRQGHINAHHVLMSLIFQSVNPVKPESSLGMLTDINPVLPYCT